MELSGKGPAIFWNPVWPASTGCIGPFLAFATRRFYLAVALILVAVVIRWGVWSEHSVGATGRGNAVSGSSHRRKLDPNADLSVFDKLLISLGLAEGPDAPEYKGNPENSSLGRSAYRSVLLPRFRSLRKDRER